MEKLPARKPLRLGCEDYTAGSFFVTICTHGRKALFWDNVGADIIRPQEAPLSPLGLAVRKAVEAIPSYYENVTIDKYCIMPDHIHMILVFDKLQGGRMISAPTLSKVVGSMKRWVSRQAGRPVWQKSFFDHGIRGRQDHEEIWTYIENNPLKYLTSKESRG